MGFRSFMESAAAILPQVPKPEKKLGLTEKLIWTAVAVVVYLVMASIPLYGNVGAQNQFTFLRVIFASSAGTLMELGIGPIVTAGLVMQLLAGSEMLHLNFSDQEDRRLFSAATKVLTFIVITAEAGAYILAGVLGPVSFGAGLILFFELFSASVIVFLLDAMLQKGWGIGSGISLFILAGVAQTVMWYTFSPISVSVTSTTSQIFGFIPAVISAAFSGSLGSMISRSANNFPDLITFSFTAVTILVIIYIENIRVELPIASTQYRGYGSVYPIKLLYVSNIPVILVGAISSNVEFFSNIAQRLNWGAWLGSFDKNGNPIGGLTYYITSPNGIAQTMADPIRALTFSAFMITLSIFFAFTWVTVGGLSPRKVAEELKGANMHIPGFRNSTLALEQKLNRYIPSITFLGGLVIGIIAAVSSLVGVFGTGIGLLLMVDITIQYYQQLVKEELTPGLAGVLGED